MGSNGDEDKTPIDILKIPVLDLRDFCQDELLLAAELSGHFPDAWFPNLIIPTLDKNIFNTSVASRKQTYRRRPRIRPRAEPNSSTSAYQAAVRLQIPNQKQSKLLPLVSKKAQAALRADLNKSQTAGLTTKGSKSGPSTGDLVVAEDRKTLVSNGSKSPQSTNMKERSSKSVAVDSRISNGDLNSATSDWNPHAVSSHSGSDRADTDADALREPRKQNEDRAPQATGWSEGAAPQPLQKRMRMKDGARNRSLYNKQGGHYALQSIESKGVADSQQVSSSHQNQFSPSQGLEDLGNASEMTMVGENLGSFKSEMMELGSMCGVGKVNGEVSLLKAEDAWVSRHMEKNTLVARGFSKGWEVTVGFRKSNEPDCLEFYNYESFLYKDPNILGGGIYLED